MQRATRSSSTPGAPACQALKKSTCMVEYAPEESVGSPLVVGMFLNRKFVWSRGTGYGWLGGHPADPASTMCERWGMALGSLGSVSVTGCPVESTARQSGKKMRTTNVALSPHRVGGVGDQLPPRHLHSVLPRPPGPSVL
jgi:hypothetical protein